MAQHTKNSARGGPYKFHQPEIASIYTAALEIIEIKYSEVLLTGSQVSLFLGRPLDIWRVGKYHVNACSDVVYAVY